MVIALTKEKTLLESINLRNEFKRFNANLYDNTTLKMQSKNLTKLGLIAHFSTLPFKTCYQNCTYCYAVKSVKMYPSVKANYSKNTHVLNNGGFLPNVPKNRNVVRMYVSGDFQNIHTIKQWISLATKPENKNVMFYGYTKQWKNPELLPFLKTLNNLDNVIIRASVDNETGYNIPEGFVKAGILEDNIKDGKFFVCKSTKKNGLKCDKCKVCFSVKHKNVPVYFPKH